MTLRAGRAVPGRAVPGRAWVLEVKLVAGEPKVTLRATTAPPSSDTCPAQASAAAAAAAAGEWDRETIYYIVGGRKPFGPF